MALIFVLFFNAVYDLLSLKWLHAAMAFVSRRLKHTVLRYAHPSPCIVNVGVERATSLPGMIMSGFAAQDDTVLVTPTSAMNGQICLYDIEDQDRPCGLMAAVRYVGRRGYLYPTTPANALLIDVGLDAVADLIGVLDHLEMNGHGSEDKAAILPVVFYHMQQLERGFHPRHVWIDGFDQRSVLDVCWAGIFQWMFANNVIDGVGDDFPNLSCWWHHVRHENGDESDGWSCGGSESEDDKTL